MRHITVLRPLVWLSTRPLVKFATHLSGKLTSSPIKRKDLPLRYCLASNPYEQPKRFIAKPPNRSFSTRNENEGVLGYVDELHVNAASKPMETTYVDGKLHHTYKEFYEDGKISAEMTYVDKILNGRYQKWHKNGAKSIESTYVDGEQHGLRQEWYDNGIKSNETTYVNGKIHGMYHSWYKDGSKYFEAMYVDGKLDKINRRWWLSDSSIHEYKNGKAIRVVSVLDNKRRECVLPSGDIIVWKACESHGENVIVQLKVPKEAKRVTPIDPSNYKSRVEYAVVQRITDANGNDYKEATSSVYPNKKLVYKVGEEVWPDGFDDNIQKDCTQGIHVQLHKDHCEYWFYH
jgi:hypothetical protein